MKNKVRELRIGNNLTQSEVAGDLGVSRQTIFAIETAKYIPSAILAIKIAKYFNKKVEEIFFLEAND